MGMLVAGGVIYIFVLLGKLLYGQEGMGGGDVKLGALIGIFIGWKLSLLAIFLSCIIGSIVSIILIILKKKGRRDYIAFGPFLSLGALIALLWGEDILRWYLSRW
jgi:leader peptidase (prepilin peptidase)/N-methyltransferase